jgi:predicted dehydrogenase
MSGLRFAAIGAGFWSTYQLAGWYEVGGAQCVAVWNRTRAKAEQLARRFNIPNVYDDVGRLLDHADLDFVDVITDPDTHGRFTRLAAERRLPIVCQKPLAPTLAEAEEMFAVCQCAGVPLLVNENFRWQTPIRALKDVLDTRLLGDVFRARVQFVNSFPVFDNQPFLRELDQFILTDVGTHILDVARFLFGEADSLFARTARINSGIRGEDVATVMLAMTSGATVLCELSYASRTEYERFPQTFVFVEAARGSVELTTDYWLRVTTSAGTQARRQPPPYYAWADPRYDVVHASIVDCQRNLLSALSGQGTAETTAEDNLKTLRLVNAAYDSARENRVIRL